MCSDIQSINMGSFSIYNTYSKTLFGANKGEIYCLGSLSKADWVSESFAVLCCS